MASSRLEKIGTIFSRITGLLRAGAMKMEDRPIWYDLYRAFPPTYQPKFDRPAVNIKIKNILYEEDFVRVKFHKKLGKNIPAVNLNDKKSITSCQKVIHLCNKITTEKKTSLEQTFEEAFDILKLELSMLQPSKTSNKKSNFVSDFKEVSEKTESPSFNINVKDILK